MFVRVRPVQWFRRMLVLVVLLLGAVLPAPGMAVDPATSVAGSGKAWFAGDIQSQVGLNCLILGAPYSEIMVQGSGSYGGLSGIPAVNQGYWVAFLVSVPGNPCGPGTSMVQTDLALPAGTTFDDSRPIRCFGKPRNSSDFIELTGSRWDAFGSQGDYCPADPFPSSVVSGGLQVGYRPVVNGQMFQVFVPVRSSQSLNGIAGSRAFRWYSTATGVYENPGVSTTWATVLAAATGGSPAFIESKTGALPFWKANAPTTPRDTRSRVETWLNLYANNLGGTLCFEIRRQSNSSALVTCSDNAGLGFNGSIAPNQPVVQVNPAPGDSTGPTGGYVPVAFLPAEWGTPVNLIWKFTPSSGSVVTKTIPFTILNGPDVDADGVADASDACPGVKGTLANGCLPPPAEDPDRDGVYGATDLCPAFDGRGAFNGCPGGVVQSAPGGGQQSSGTSTVPSSGAGPVAGPSRASIKAPVTLKVTAGARGRITAVGRIPAATARALRVPEVVARGSALARRPGVVPLRLAPTGAAKRQAKKLRGVVMTVTVKVPGRAGASTITILLT